MNRILFVSAENDGIANCKAGGMADVVRDIPRHISECMDAAHVVVPSYGRLHQGGRLITTLHFPLRGEIFEAEIYQVKPKKEYRELKHYVIHHPEITAGGIAHIYHDDPEEPFYNDAIKYFIFCTAVAEAIKKGLFGSLDIVHLHDWHTSTVLFLRGFHPEYRPLKPIRFVYSIHNLAIQGIRPFRDNYASVDNWFRDVPYDEKLIRDERYTDCINLMAVGIRLADAVHTVSPSYKEDVMRPSSAPEFIGGEGLENDLLEADAQGRLFGILNGCNYKKIRRAKKGQLFFNIVRVLFPWLQEESKKYKSDFLAHTGEKITPYLQKDPEIIVSSVARLTEQKFYFFKKSPEALDQILHRLKRKKGVFILLGTGAPEYEELFRQKSYEHSNFIFINGQSEDVIDSLYLECDLYFMPSLFEPCGISQMLAMRNSHPCLVHATGGLKDTVEDMVTGFQFDGESYEEKIEQMLNAFDKALDLFFNQKRVWNRICRQAGAQRFTWEHSVEQYYDLLYQLTPTERNLELKPIESQQLKVS